MSRTRIIMAVGPALLLLTLVIPVRPALSQTRSISDEWAFQPVQVPSVPVALTGMTGANPVDAFVRLKQAEQSVIPAPPADRRTLVRRLHLDLLGLPPTPEAVESFVSDPRPDAPARLVDRLLASPAYGERWARHWLDVVRFGESQGFEYDRIRDHAWRYRDYVIQAFNSDKPYDQFIRDQLAGDVLEPATTEGIVATGFLVAGPWDQAGNSAASASLKAMVREAELEDLLGTVGQTFLGVTLNCARCHNHKFDPVSQADYFRVKAVFQGVRHGDRSILTRQEQQDRERERSAREARRTEITSRVGDLEASARERWRAQSIGSAPGASTRPVGPAPASRWNFERDAQDQVGSWHGELRGGARVEGGRLRLDGKDDVFQTGALGRELGQKTLEVWLALTSLEQKGGGALTVETPEGGQFDSVVFGERQSRKWTAGSEGFQRTQDLGGPDETAGPGELVAMTVVYQDNGSIAVYRNGQPYGTSYVPSGESGTLKRFPAGSRILMGQRHTGGGQAFLAGEIEEARVYDRALTASEVAESFAAGPSASGPARGELLGALTPEERREMAALELERDELEQRLKEAAKVPQSYAANPSEPGPTHVLNRGEPDKPREAVGPAALTAVKSLSADLGLSAESPEAERRRRFADWVASPDNPLTARTVVNRVWQHHFGRGLVATPNDLGKMGERPSHPELLDWLANWFVSPEGGAWSLKRLHRLILNSETWRQSSGQIPAAGAAAPSMADADNRWLGRFSPRRLEAETVRDSLLMLAGELNRGMGGPGFRPFTHKGNGGQNEYFAADLEGPEYSRRTVYRLCVHSARDPLLDSLDCPEFSTRTPVRPSTTTPLQALSLMNNPFVQRMANGLAAQVREKAGSRPSDQVSQIWLLAFGRQPKAEEIPPAMELVEAHGLEALAWTLLNTTEFVTVR